MRVEFTNHADQGFLEATLSGDFSLEEAERTFVQIVQSAIEHKVARVLVDAQGVQGEPTALQRFCYGEFAAKVVRELYSVTGLRAPTFAYLMSHPVLDARRLGENVAANRGLAVKAFDSAADAFKWLGLAQTS